MKELEQHFSDIVRRVSELAESVDTNGTDGCFIVASDHPLVGMLLTRAEKELEQALKAMGFTKIGEMHDEVQVGVETPGGNFDELVDALVGVLKAAAADEQGEATSGPRNTQVGGDHYAKLAIQPMEFAESKVLTFPEASILKYVTRNRSKGGAKDLAKAAHIAELAVAIRNGQDFSDVSFAEYCKVNELTPEETEIIVALGVLSDENADGELYALGMRHIGMLLKALAEK